MRMKLLEFLLFSVIINFAAGNLIEIDLNNSLQDAKKLPRFWTNSGFAPPQPIDDVEDFFHSEDVKRNLEIIGSLPNRGISHVRIHWLLNLLKIRNVTRFHIPIYNFDSLDRFIDDLKSFNLNLHLEFMTTLKLRHRSAFVWEDFSYQIMSRYMERFGTKAVRKWKLETWNEPDLKGYNVLNFEVKDYFDYTIGISRGLRAAERLYNQTKIFKLRGPAGLFKNEDRHQFCWGLLEACDENPSNCPIDLITFHAKGQGRTALEILDRGQELVDNIMEEFPMLGGMKYSNTEADPIKRWSESRPFQSDIRYASILATTVLAHWRAIFDRDLPDLESISHDNSFLSYPPLEFEQRTLLARFQINNTKPRSVQFVQKPVFASLGLLGNLGATASNVVDFEHLNVSMVVSRSPGSSSYYSIFLTSVIDNENYSEISKNLTFKISNLKGQENEKLRIFMEAIDARTNPYKVFQYFNRPAFPNSTVFQAMRSIQDPVVLKSMEVEEGQQNLIFNVTVRLPFVASIRICGESDEKLGPVRNVRLRRIDEENVLVFWSDRFYKARCIKTYEVFFKSKNPPSKWKSLTKDVHVPFLYRQFSSQQGFNGCFKIRAVDIFDKPGKFSKLTCYN